MADDPLTLPAPRQAIRLRPAESLERAALGESLLVDGRGDVVGPAGLRRRGAFGWAVLGATAAAAGGLYTVVFGAAAGVLVVGLTGGLVAWRLRFLAPLRRALALSAGGHRDEAWTLLLDLEGRRLPAAHRDVVLNLLASLAWLRGDHAEAARRYDHALARLRGRTGRSARTYEWIARFGRAELHATTGEVEAARQARDLLGDAPPGALYEMLRQSLALSIAFHGGADTDLPDDDTLYDWARAALARNRFGGMLVTLAWAVDRRGDRDLACHLLAEAPARLDGEYLPDSQPRVHAWLTEHLRAWAIEPAGGA